ncbi:MAG: glycosyltransferase family 2 protein [Thermodesulfobacteriota bacterium]
MRILLNIVIPALNLWDMTARCLRSLAENTPGTSFRVTLVDNGSDDPTPAEAPDLGRSLFGDRFGFVRNEENRNFGPACNQGAAACEAEFVLFLNNDTLLTPGWNGPLLAAFLEDPGLGAAGPLLLYPGSRRVQHAGIAFAPTLAVEHVYEQFPASHPALARRRKLQAATGAALMLRSAVFASCGGFHPDYVNGSEDMDLCRQVRRTGLTVSCIPESTVLHFASATPGRFSHDDANAALLRRRCPDGFVPDLHALAREDGYELRLTPWLSAHLALPAARESELDRILAGTPEPARWLEALLAEPLWRGGYAALGRHLESRGLWAEATELRFLEACFFPQVETYKALRRAAGKAGHLDLARDAAARLEHIAGLLADRQRLAAAARAAAARLRDQGEEELALECEGIGKEPA